MIHTRLVCERCRRESHPRRNERDAPVMLRHHMRRQGWQVAERGGPNVDLCPACRPTANRGDDRG